MMAARVLHDMMQSEPQALKPLKLTTKLAYGLGHLGIVLPGTLQAIFRLFFLTNVAGLNPGFAVTVLLIGKVWDAVNDPLIGWLSDRTHTRWGRRYPWIVLGIIPFGVFFAFQWFIPQLGSDQWLLFAYYVIMVLLFDTAQTTIKVPYLAIASELTQNYAERNFDSCDPQFP